MTDGSSFFYIKPTTDYTDSHGVYLIFNVIQSICHSDDHREEESREHIAMEYTCGCTRDPSLHSVPFWMTR